LTQNRARFVAPNALLLGDKLVIGEGTWVVYFCLLDAQLADLKIGRHCDISSGVHIYTHSTHLRCTERGKKVIGSVELEDHVFVGANSVLLPGTKIGHHSVVGALTVVKGMFPPNSLIAGAPAEVKRKLKKTANHVLTRRDRASTM
jgi:acetyltransferase-like isoleucine patch superfamily enzyme